MSNSPQSLWWAEAALAAGATVLFFATAMFLRRKWRARLAARVAASRSASSFASLALDDFQIVVGDAFRAQGYEVRELHGLEAGDGIDMQLWRDGRHYLVDCNHWRAYKVPVAAVRELYLLVESHDAAGAFLVTSGMFSEDAKTFAQDTTIRLVDGQQLFDLIRKDPAPAPA